MLDNFLYGNESAQPRYRELDNVHADALCESKYMCPSSLSLESQPRISVWLAVLLCRYSKRAFNTGSVAPPVTLCSSDDPKGKFLVVVRNLAQGTAIRLDCALERR